jgi:hypothetical protein
MYTAVKRLNAVGTFALSAAMALVVASAVVSLVTPLHADVSAIAVRHGTVRQGVDPYVGARVQVADVSIDLTAGSGGSTFPCGGLCACGRGSCARGVRVGRQICRVCFTGTATMCMWRWSPSLRRGPWYGGLAHRHWVSPSLIHTRNCPCQAANHVVIYDRVLGRDAPRRLRLTNVSHKYPLSDYTLGLGYATAALCGGCRVCALCSSAGGGCAVGPT